MALLWIEGFETCGTANPPDGLEEKYNTSNRVNLTDTTTGRSGTGTAWLANTSASAYIQTATIGSTDEFFIGFAFRTEVLANQPICQIYDSSAALGLNLRLTASGELAVYRNTTLLGTSSGAGITTNVWYYIEWGGLINNSTGTYDVLVNEVNVLSGTGADTLQTGATWGQVRFTGSAIFPHNFAFDDIYILDETGSTNNTFLGSVKVQGIFPDAAGDSTDWTPDSGSNYARVNENPADEDTSYVESGTSTDRDLYNFDATSNLGTVYGLQTNIRCRLTDANAFSLNTVVKSGTTTDVGSSQAIPSTSYRVLHNIYELDPDTSLAWVASDIDSAQFGFEVN